MGDKVVKAFRAIEYKEHINDPGQDFPPEGVEVTEERKQYLRDKGFIKQVKEESVPSEPAFSDFPKHTGGGWYELSNGEKVQGKDEAKEAQRKAGD